MDHIHPKTPALEYNYITDGIYIGTNQCCVMGLAEVLKKENITADISLEEDRLDAPFGVDMYVWIPIIDKMAPTQDQLSFGAESIEKLVSQNRKVYVHCKNGHGRAPTLVSAYLIRKGYKPAEAVDFVVSKRPSVHLYKTQEEALKKYYENLYKK
ncbi:MAG: dual specificity protein phosphatase family protein [bacterium]|nr:dual specificity protein phosphatase family protein [bacterium]